MELTTTSGAKLGLPNANISGLLIRMEEVGLLRTVREQITVKDATQSIYTITAYGEKYEGIYREWRAKAEADAITNPKRSHHKKHSVKEYISRRTIAEMPR
jgi:DNA-binding PadR family transcriptional regulator